MSVYLDSSFVVSLYESEARSVEAASVMMHVGVGAVVSALTDVEVAAALRKHLSPRKQDGYVLYRRDRALGLYATAAIDPEVFDRGIRLAEQYAGKYYLRSLDILHLAIVQRYGLGQIATFDDRSGEAASALGISVLPARS